MIYRQLALASTPEAVSEVEALMEEIRKDLDVKPDAYANIMVALTEAVNNAVIHGNKSDPGKKVYVEFECPSDFRLLVRVHDEGTGFDPGELPDPTAPENLERIGGRGVFLMRNLSDSIAFSDNGQEVEMLFNI
ncbi:MAG: ATP-binding protein [Bacteroidia bacterium]